MKNEMEQKIDLGMQRELATAGPQHVQDVVEKLLEETPNSFPRFKQYGIKDLDMGCYVEFPYYINTVIAYRDLRSRLRNGDRRYDVPGRFRLDYLGEIDQGSGDMLPDDHKELLTLEEILRHGDE